MTAVAYMTCSNTAYNSYILAGLYQTCNFDLEICECTRNQEGDCLPPPPRCEYNYDTCSAYAMNSDCHPQMLHCSCPGGAIVGGRCYTDENRKEAAVTGGDVAAVSFHGVGGGECPYRYERRGSLLCL